MNTARSTDADHPIKRYEDASGVWLEVFQTKDGYRLEFPSYARFWLNETGDLTLTEWEPGCDPRIRDFLLSRHVVPRRWSCRGLAIHGAALVRKQAGLGLVGESGAGKSLLTTYTILKSDWQYVSDDCLLLQDSPGGFRLEVHSDTLYLPPDYFEIVPPLRGNVTWTEPYSGSVAFRPRAESRAVSSLIPLRRLLFLEKSIRTVPPRIVACSPAYAARKLPGSLFRLDPGNPKHLMNEFRLLGKLLDTVPVGRLIYPHHAAALPQIVELLGGSLKDATP